MRNRTVADTTAIVDSGRAIVESDTDMGRKGKSIVWRGKTLPLWLCIAVVCLVAAVTMFILWRTNATSVSWPPPSLSPMGKYAKAAVAADNQFCSEIGRDIMIRGGNAIDAAVATVICIGVMDAHSSGIGGGHFLTFYRKSEKKCIVIDARDRAPLKAHKDMYKNDKKASTIGWKAIAVPGELHGLYTAYKNFGSRNLKWAELIQPTIDLLTNGYPVSDAVAKALNEKKDSVINEPSLSIFINSKTGKLYKTGEIMKRPVLANTLRRIANANDPIVEFYQSGTVRDDLISDLKSNGALINESDLLQYESIIRKQEDVIYVDLGEASGLVSCGPPPPSSAIIAQAILNIMFRYHPKKSTFSSEALTYHQFLEATKFAYARRAVMGDMNFVPDALAVAKNMTKNSYAESIVKLITDRAHPLSYYSADIASVKQDHGTSHISIVDQHGNAVSVTTTINLYFGSKRRSESTGIILNDGMDDFSTPGKSNYFGYPPSPSNFIYPGKRPMSSMSPSLVFNRTNGEVDLVVGAAGGSRIISGTAYVAMRMFLFGETVKEALDAPRIHNQFIPNATSYERGFPDVLHAIATISYSEMYLQKLQEFVAQLRSRGQLMSFVDKPLSVATAIRRGSDGFWYANSDRRKGTASATAGF